MAVKSGSEKAARLRSKIASLRYGRGSQSAKIIAVTGAHGKSTVVKLIAEVLREGGLKVVEMVAASDAEHSFETDPFLLHRRLVDVSRQGYDYVVLEVHAALVASQAIPTVTIDTLVATGDSPELAAFSAVPVRRAVLPCGLQPPAGVEHHNLMTYGTQDDADMKIVARQLYRKGTELSLVIDQHTELEVASYLVGEANAINIATALATAYVIGVDIAKFAEGLARVERVMGNYDYLATGAPYAVAVDRGGTLEALPTLLESARQLAKRRLIVALDMPLTTEELARLYKHTDRLIAVADTTPVEVDQAADHEEAAFVAVRGAKRDDLVLLVGPRYAVYNEQGRPVIEGTIGVWHE